MSSFCAPETQCDWIFATFAYAGFSGLVTTLSLVPLQSVFSNQWATTSRTANSWNASPILATLFLHLTMFAVFVNYVGFPSNWQTHIKDYGNYRGVFLFSLFIVFSLVNVLEFAAKIYYTRIYGALNKRVLEKGYEMNAFGKIVDNRLKKTMFFMNYFSFLYLLFSMIIYVSIFPNGNNDINPDVPGQSDNYNMFLSSAIFVIIISMFTTVRSLDHKSMKKQIETYLDDKGMKYIDKSNVSKDLETQFAKYEGTIASNGMDVSNEANVISELIRKNIPDAKYSESMVVRGINGKYYAVTKEIALATDKKMVAFEMNLGHDNLNGLNNHIDREVELVYYDLDPFVYVDYDTLITHPWALFRTRVMGYFNGFGTYTDFKEKTVVSFVLLLLPFLYFFFEVSTSAFVTWIVIGVIPLCLAWQSHIGAWYEIFRYMTMSYFTAAFLYYATINPLYAKYYLLDTNLWYINSPRPFVVEASSPRTYIDASASLEAIVILSLTISTISLGIELRKLVAMFYPK